MKSGSLFFHHFWRNFFTLNNPIIYSLLLLFVVLSLIFIFYYSIIIPMRKSQKKKLTTLNTQLKRLSNSLNSKIEEERNRIARELHDNIGQNLYLLKLKLQNYHSHLLPKSNQKETFNGTIELLSKIITDLKKVSLNLKPAIIEEMGLEPAVDSLCRRISDESLIKSNFNMLGFKDRLEPELEITIYRIVQEALNNIVKHSGANLFSVQLINTGKVIRLIISDDGQGFVYNNGNQLNGIGLINIRERINSYKGIFKVDSSPGNGTTLIAEIPAGK